MKKYSEKTVGKEKDLQLDAYKDLKSAIKGLIIMFLPHMFKITVLLMNYSSGYNLLQT